MALFSKDNVGENLKRQLLANTAFEASSNVLKRQKVFAVRTYPDLIKRVTKQINQPTNESLGFVDSVSNSSCKNDNVCDEEEDSFEPFEVDDLEYQETNDTICDEEDDSFELDDLEYREINDTVCDEEDDSFELDDLEYQEINDTVCDEEDDSLEPFELDDLEENQEILASTQMHIVSNDVEEQINLVANKAMNSSDKESVDKLEGGFESFKDNLKSQENCVDKDSGSERPKDSDNEGSGDQVDTFIYGG